MSRNMTGDWGVTRDVFAMAVPEEIDVDDPRVMAVLPAKLNKIAEATIHQQWFGDRQPVAVQIDAIDWLITKEPGDVEAFQPAHDCAACRAGNDQSLAFLRTNPGRYIALANLTYRAVWS